MASILKELIQGGLVKVAKLPAKNDFPIENLNKLDGYTIPLMAHDYGAKTAVMWNTLYEKLGLNLRNIMVLADPKNLEKIFNAFREDPKYFGGGAAGGLKEAVVKHLDEIRPPNLKSVNIIVKEDGKLIGYNTDTYGFIRSLEEKFREIGSELKGKKVVVFGAGGVAKEVVNLLAEKGVSSIYIVNRTFSKAVDLASRLNQKYGDIAQGLGEELIRGIVLNSLSKPDALINLTNKGSDGPLVDQSFLAPVDECGNNETLARQILEMLKGINPNVLIGDIALTKRGKTKTLAMAESYKIRNLLDGIPMVVYQAGPAYLYIQNAHPDSHKKKVTLEEALEVFKVAAKN